MTLERGLLTLEEALERLQARIGSLEELGVRSVANGYEAWLLGENGNVTVAYVTAETLREALCALAQALESKP